ncbi:MAG TPA: PEGA domain-containing protein [Polyangiaceae bacterium]|nr:PEGA domain-containing protein [Polyangiaceae bacterium]
MSRGCLLLLGGALLIAPVPRAARAQTASDAPPDVENEKALQTFKEGIAAFDRRDFEAARVAFLQTFALKPSAPVVRRNLGLAEIYSGHYLEGARRLGRVIHTTDEGTSVDRARMVESLKKAEAHLERVTVEVNVEGAEIQIGDVDLGLSPLQFAWYLEPGAYDVHISKPGFVAYDETRVARAGNAQHLRVSLKPIVAIEEPVAEAPVAPSPPSPPRDVGRGGLSPWVLVAGGTLTAGGLVTGLTLRMLAADNADKVQRIGDSLVGLNCRVPAPQACRELDDAAAAHDRQVRWATVSFALGAAAGVSTLVYALLASASDRHGGSAAADATAGAETATGFGVGLGEHGTEFILHGSF